MRTPLLVAALALAVVAGSASAEEIKGQGTFAWLGVGTTFMVGENHPYFTGAFSGVQIMDDASNPLNFAAVQCPGVNDLAVGSTGYCITTDADGDKVYGKFACSAIAPVKGAVSGCEGAIAYEGGTGKFAKAKGSNNFRAFTTVIHPDGTASGYTLLTDFNLSY